MPCRCGPTHIDVGLGQSYEHYHVNRFRGLVAPGCYTSTLEYGNHLSTITWIRRCNTESGMTTIFQAGVCSSPADRAHAHRDRSTLLWRLYTPASRCPVSERAVHRRRSSSRPQEDPVIRPIPATLGIMLLPPVRP
ncbi:uncharacterized protein LOC142802870 isoform X1 [Rhipicephalus microplus]|uniref:uncharacterized protein LOC142802870 isoform X1 n=1 Tax=Rhipicephalus microplus TaxID=6941 RepID=UPI003F6CE507